MTLLAAIGIAATAQAQSINGAGATFPAPLYSKWAEAYNKETGVRVNYQSIGSGAGIRQIEGRTVTFGASDMPLRDDKLTSLGATQFPTAIGGVVPVINLKDVKPGEMRLTGQVIAEIFLGNIKKWNDPAITKLNPTLKLPDQEIVVVRRADGSGTTFVWTNYLGKANAEFAKVVGEGTAVKWPVGIGGKGNEGVAANVQRVKGAFGYVEYAYAKKNKIAWAQLKNRDGNFVQPDDSTFKAAAANADWANAPGMYLLLTWQTGKDAWPATGASFILMHKQQADALTGRAILKFFDWSYKNGAKMSEELEYVHMPQSVIKLVQDNWKKDYKGPDNTPIWK